MNKPTPAQARALRSLAAEYERVYRQPYLDLWTRSNGSIRSIRNHNMGKGKIRISTARILLSNLWIKKLPNYPSQSRYVISDTGYEILATLDASDYISPISINSSIWNTADIRDSLIEKYRKLNDKGYESAPIWIFFSELGNHRYASRRVDFWAMACWKSLNYKKIAYEIKISRADFLKEIRDPTKRQFALSISDQFYFVTPPDLIALEELPDECGLIELDIFGNLISKKRAPTRVTLFEFSWGFASTLGRSLFRSWEKESLP